jgi:hypothetical protein
MEEGEGASEPVWRAGPVENHVRLDWGKKWVTNQLVPKLSVHEGDMWQTIFSLVPSSSF